MTKKIKNLFTIAIMFLFVALTIPTITVNAVNNTKLNKSEMTIYKHQVKRLTLSGTNKPIIWSTSNKKVATVTEKGYVKAKKIGTTTITAKIKNGKSYKCKVTVKKPYINHKKKTIVVGQTTKIKLIGAKVKSIKSSDTAIATVDKKGKVTGKKAGTTTISITGVRGKVYKCKVTVIAPTISTENLSIHIGMPGVLSLNNAKIKSATSSDTGIATVDTTGRVIGHNVGTAIITLTSQYGTEHRCMVTVNAALKDYTGFDEWGDGYVYDPNQNFGLKAFDMDFPIPLYTPIRYNGQVGYFRPWGSLCDRTKEAEALKQMYLKYTGETDISHGTKSMGIYNGVKIGWQGWSKRQ